MPDPVTTGFAALAAGHILKDSCTRLLGPTADYLGIELKEWTEAKVKRFRRIASSAERKSGNRLAEAGAVHARVFKKIIDDGCFCNDGLSADYYGGFLASSRSKDGMDDANVPFVSMISRLSSDQIHGHWILYSLLFNKMHDIHGKHLLNVYIREHRKEAALYIPWRTFMFLFEALRTDHIEDADPKFTFSGADKYHHVTVSDELLSSFCPKAFSPRRLDLVFWGLLSEDLVEHMYWGMTGHELEHQMHKDFQDDPLGIGPKKFDKKKIADVMKGGTFADSSSMAQGGVVFQPSILGMDLFLRAQGLPPEPAISFNSLKYDFRPDQFAEDILKNVRLVGSAGWPRKPQASRSGPGPTG